MQQNKGFIQSLLYKYLNDSKDIVAFNIYDGKNVKEITYGQFAIDVLKSAKYFSDNKITNQHIGILASYSYEWLVTFFAISATGNTVVAMNQYLPKEEILWQCKKADVSMIIKEVIDESYMDFEYIECIDYLKLKNNNSLDINDLIQTNPERSMILIFTSGTTGRSKAVEITEKGFNHAIINQEEIMNLLTRERIYFTIPMFHIAGIKIAFAALYRDIVLCIGRGIRYMLQDIPVLEPTGVFMVPSMVEALVKTLKMAKSEEDRKKILGNKLNVISLGGAYVNPETCKYIMSLGLNVEIGYSMTELTGDGTWVVLDESSMDTIGKPIGEMECKIVEGEFLFRGPSLMKGYYKDLEETEKIIKDSWLYTGDLGYQDENGYLHITGRKKNTIILPNGENVSPEQVEIILHKNPNVLECMVYNDEKGICVDLYTDNEESARKAVKDYNVTVPKYRQIYKINISKTPLEKNITGKIKRKVNTYV